MLGPGKTRGAGQMGAVPSKTKADQVPVEKCVTRATSIVPCAVEEEGDRTGSSFVWEGNV